MRKLLLALVLGLPLTLSLGACTSGGSGGGAAKQVAADPKTYFGTWKGEGTTLTISENQVAYEQKKGAMNKSLTGRFSGLDGYKVKVNVLITDMTIDVAIPPHEEKGEWVMWVDGTRLVRQ